MPRNLNKKEKYPLVITFHNSTRIGNDNENQLEPLARIWLREEISEQYPSYVIAPQFNKRSSNYINNSEGVLVSVPSDEVSILLDLIKRTIKENPNIDSKRIYLIGYSMGGSTAQNLMSMAPGKFAALIAIAPVPDDSNLRKLNQKNIWLIHGEQDNENPYEGSKYLFGKLSNNKNLTFTSYTHLNHNNITIPFLITNELPKWLFKH